MRKVKYVHYIIYFIFLASSIDNALGEETNVFIVNPQASITVRENSCENINPAIASLEAGKKVVRLEVRGLCSKIRFRSKSGKDLEGWVYSSGITKLDKPSSSDKFLGLINSFANTTHYDSNKTATLGTRGFHADGD